MRNDKNREKKEQVFRIINIRMQFSPIEAAVKLHRVMIDLSISIDRDVGPFEPIGFRTQ
jgi:hypothetical protein